MSRKIIRTAENAGLICERLSEGWTLRQVARDLDCKASAIINWVESDEIFRERYTRAMERRWERMSEELQEIADEGTNDWMEREGIAVPDHEHIQRSRLRVDTRKWLLSKMMPKKYGDRTVLAGDPENPVHVATTIEDKRAEAKALLDQAFGEK
jgi:hypothetical protein